MSPILVESRACFHESVEIVAVVVTACVAEILVVPVFVVDDGCWVHPAAHKRAAMRIPASSMERTGDDMVKLVGRMRK